MNKQKGFTLIELLVVIGIIALIVGASLPNFVGARERARDQKLKAEMNQVRSALRLYYTDYGQYPAGTMLNGVKGCGLTGTSDCPYAGCTGDFTAGGVAGCDTLYMMKFPDGLGNNTIQYKQCTGADDFRLIVSPENKSDGDILKSQAKCPAASCGVSNYSTSQYVVCAD